MMSFPSWHNSCQKGIDKRLTYATGSETFLRERVLAYARTQQGTHVTVWGEDGEDNFLREAFTNSLWSGERKIITVRNAEHIKDWVWAARWFREMKSVSLYLESTEPFEHEYNQSRTVNCGEHTKPSAARDLKAYLAKLFGVYVGQIEVVLKHTQGRIDPAMSILRKLIYLGAPITDQYIRALGVPFDVSLYEHALRHMDRAKAVSYAPLVPTNLVGEILDRADDWLAKAARASVAMAAGSSPNEVAGMVSMDRKQAAKLCAEARRYNSIDISRATLALAEASRAYHKGARIGILEVLATQW